MPNPCPQPGCSGRLHSKGKGRSPRCNECGYSEPKKRGRPRKDSLTRNERYRATADSPRQILYVLFDGPIEREALVGIVEGRSRQEVEDLHQGLTAVPFTSLAQGQKRWIYEAENTL
jgi:hypothetical protein